MSWSFSGLQGDAEHVAHDIEDALPEVEGRAKEVVDAVSDFFQRLTELHSGGHVFASAHGHTNEDPGHPGDSLTVSFGSLPNPGASTLSDPVDDPGHSIAQPQPADGSPAAPPPPTEEQPGPVPPPAAPQTEPGASSTPGYFDPAHEQAPSDPFAGEGDLPESSEALPEHTQEP